MKPVRIIGIDPGFDRLGVAVIDKEVNKETLVYSTSIVTSRSDTFEDRIIAIGNELEKILQTYTPSECVVEKLFFAKNQTTAIQVAEVRGVVLYVARKAGLSIYEYSPPQIKLAVTGYGKATKQDVGVMVGKILHIPPQAKQLDDELDAIAIALTHSAHRKTLLWK